MNDDVLAEQVAYYRARAPEYDEWWLRQGRYALGEDEDRQWRDAVENLERALAELHPGGHILELACGTGYGTAQLAQWADEVTALDISPEMIEQARSRLAGVATPVTFLQADIFDWTAPRRYDVVFFSFWLSHVPPDRFAAFWTVVRHALAPGGRAIFLDSGALDSPHEHTTEEGATTVVRQLNDGREFRIVKVFYRPDELERRLRELGWSLEARMVGPFLVGAAEITDHSP